MLLLVALTLPLNATGVLAAANSNQSSGAVSTTNSYTATQISSAAVSVNNYYTSNKKLPNYVTISNQQVSMPQFLYLMASETSQIGSEGTTATIPAKDVNWASAPVENISSGKIQKAQYLTIANNLKNFIETNDRIPNYINTPLGNMRYESAVVMFSKIMTFYNTNKRTPNYVTITPWLEGSNVGNTTPGNSVSQSQLIEAAVNLKSYMGSNNAIPANTTIAGQKITITQLLPILAQGLLNINSGNTSSLPIISTSPAINPVENLTSGTITKSEYLSMALTLLNFTSTNNRIPNYLNTSLGQMRYESALNMFLKVINFYNTNQRLPNYVSVSPWGTSTPPATGLRPVYIISDNINSKTVDNQRIDILVSALNNLGVTAYNYGAGTDNFAILRNTNVTSNALIVSISGGVCSGTLIEMGYQYYKNLVGTREVFLVWTEGATKITGLEWMPRAHDDNFSPATFTGLANPDQYLLNNGYHYYEGYTNSLVNQLAEIIYNEALS